MLNLQVSEDKSQGFTWLARCNVEKFRLISLDVCM